MGVKYRNFKKPLKIGEKRINDTGKKDAGLEEMIAKIEKLGEDAFGNMELISDLEGNYKIINGIFKNCYDLVAREFTTGFDQVKCLIIYIDGMVKKDTINDNVLKSLMTCTGLKDFKKNNEQSNFIELIKYASVSIGEVKEIRSVKDIVYHVLSGYSALFMDGSSSALAFDTKGWESRSVESAQIEPVIRGPQEAFVEDLNVNTSILRRVLKTPDLKMERFEVGRLSKTTVVVAYINGVAEEGVVSEVRKRLGRIDVDAVFESGYIEQFIEDAPLSPFPQMEVTERPDIGLKALADGRVVILTDGTPFVLIVPAVLVHFLTTSEDNYIRVYYALFIRMLRYTAFAITLLAPSVYIAITTFHQEMIPTPLLITLAISRAEVPFPAVVEALLMEITFELIREAGTRLPRFINQAISIVGVLVIGQTAVMAGIVSHAMVIVVSITAIASFTIPKFNLTRALRVLRFLMMILAASLGIFGIIMGILVILIHMASLRSFGTPYLSPLTPLNIADWKDVILKLPIWFARKRPSFIQHNNITRVKRGLKPEPPD